MTCIHPFLGRALGRAVGRAIAIASVLTVSAATGVAQNTIIDGGGFEPPAYSAAGVGTLEGQLAQAGIPIGPSPWLRQVNPTNFSLGIVQNGIVGTGSQAVQLTRSNSEDTRWGVSPGLGFPDFPCVVIDWDMYVQNSNGGASFGPFFGVEAYDTDGAGSGIGRLGMLGVDATTGEVLYSNAADGLVGTPASDVVNFNEWNHFRIILDYAFDRYNIEVNNVPLAMNIGFEGGTGLDQFTDAPLASLAAAGDPGSLAMAGTAFFDNYLVRQYPNKAAIPPADLIPEPASIGMAGLAFAALSAVGRSRKTRKQLA
jgi:hypothetical protein